MPKKLPVTKMFNELAKLGYINPAQEMDVLTFPGALRSVPSITTYGTPDIPVSTGVQSYAELEKRPSGNSAKPSNG